MRTHLFRLPIVSLAFLAVNASAATLYVNLNSTNPTPPYANWGTAATNIQDAIEASNDGDLVLVTNGVYQTGGQVVYSLLTNRIAVTKPIAVRSVNGPVVTVIQGNPQIGDTAVRCAYLTNGAVLSGFTLTNGATRLIQCECYDGGVYRGGGVCCESAAATVTNCVITACSASDSGGGADGGTFYNCDFIGNRASNPISGYGGGADNATLNNCRFSGNEAYALGGGAYYSTLNNCSLNSNFCTGGGGGASSSTLVNCTLVGNSADWDGGGAWYSTVVNSILFGNFCASDPNYGRSSLNYSCTTPDPYDTGNGTGNITNAPLFVNPVTGDFRLQTDSPCINAGNDAFVTNDTDLDGNLRIRGGTVDIGAYEYQTPSSVISYSWLQQYGLTNNGSADYADSDHDGMNNWQEWIAGTDPTDPSSLLKMLTVSNDASSSTVTWQSVDGITYFLQNSTNLAAQPAFSTIQSNIVGQADTTSYTDTAATNSGPYFYRVGVQQ